MSVPTRSRTGSEAAVLAALALADIAFGFQQTAVIPAIPTIQRGLHSGRTWSAWLLSGYLVASTVGTPLLGKLGDRHGKRRMLELALALYLAGSIVAAAAPGFGVLVGARALQGAGGAVFPLSLSIVRERLAPERTGTGVGLLTGAFGLGTALGFALSGAIVQAASWRWVFVSGAAAIALALAVVPLAVPRSDERSPLALGVVGGALMTAGIALVLVGLTEGPPLGWGNWRVVGALAAGTVAIGLWIRHDWHSDRPLLDLRALAARPVLLTNGATFLLGYVLFGLYFLIPYLVQAPVGRGAGLGVGPLDTGLFLLPAALGEVVAGSLSGPVARRLGARPAFAAGMATIGVSGAWLALLHARAWELVAGTAVLGIGSGVGIGVASALITATASGYETGVATAFNSVVRRTGGGFGSQVAAALLAAMAVASGRAYALAFWSYAAAGALGAVLLAGVGARLGARTHPRET